jgi:CheY-like chemotaxis protein
MGLAVVHGIVQSHGGAITVESMPGAGAAFTILLPRADEQTGGEHPPAAALPKGSERILFADDEEPLVQLGCRMLTSLGYRAVPALGAPAAFELFRQNPSRFDLVITDQTMPQMTGAELARQLHAIRPGIPVILCTGFSEAVNEATAQELDIRAFVLKPVKRKEIAETIRKVLDAATPH